MRIPCNGRNFKSPYKTYGGIIHSTISSTSNIFRILFTLRHLLLVPKPTKKRKTTIRCHFSQFPETVREPRILKSEKKCRFFFDCSAKPWYLYCHSFFHIWMFMYFSIHDNFLISKYSKWHPYELILKNFVSNRWTRLLENYLTLYSILKKCVTSL